MAKLLENKLEPSPKASLATLLRRMSLDITGLPPKPDQVAAYIKDSTSVDMEAIIDEFLASPAYGERMTQSWLDVARYADSHGYQDDSYRTMWPWRDWVIHAFNTNIPYDTFLTYQLAGDYCPMPIRNRYWRPVSIGTIPLPKKEGSLERSTGPITYLIVPIPRERYFRTYPGMCPLP